MAAKKKSVTAKGKTAAKKPSFPLRIDLHHHFLPRAFMEGEMKRTSVMHGNTNMLGWTPELSIQEMDKANIAFAFASTSTPGVWYGDVELGRKLAQEWTDSAMEAVQAFPTRFGVFAPIPLPDTKGSLKLIENALDNLKTDGIGLLSNYDGKWLGDESFHPVMEELNRRKAIVYVHPTFTPCCTNTVPGLSMQTLEFPFETTRTIVSLITSGTTTKFPKIRFIFAHNGGTAPMIIGRIEEMDHKPIGKNFPRGMHRELQKMYFDTASGWNNGAIGALLEIVPSSQVMFGSDYPFLPTVIAAQKMGAVKLPRAIRAEIDTMNALKLFPRLKKLKLV